MSPVVKDTKVREATGVASMVACAQAGADAVDAATDSLSGMTSQPSINAILASLEGTNLDPGLNVSHVRALDTYWSSCGFCTHLSRLTLLDLTLRSMSMKSPVVSSRT